MANAIFDQESPIQKHKWNGIEFYLKREDLLAPVGGNKVRRFHPIFNSGTKPQKVIALSDPGSHTFLVAAKYLEDHQQAVFFERNIPLTAYAKENRKRYLTYPNITVIRQPFWKLWFLWLWHKHLLSSKNLCALGVGGQTNDEFPSAEALRECERQLEQLHINGTVQHLFPIASGQMLDGFLWHQQFSEWNPNFHGVMTGPLVSQIMLKRKYKKRKTVHLWQKRKKTDVTIQQAKSFYNSTGVWLDPLHTIYLLNVLSEISKHPTNKPIIFWVTSPYQGKNMLV